MSHFIHFLSSQVGFNLVLWIGESVAPGHRKGEGSIPGQAWIFQVLFNCEGCLHVIFNCEDLSHFNNNNHDI